MGSLLVAKRSAGILLYRRHLGELEVFLVHPGGPFWVKKDLGAWTIPKGEYAEDEQPLAAAVREFHEETGFSVEGPFHELGVIRQASGKLVSGWAVEGDCDPAKLVSNLCQIEWPPRSQRKIEIPEVDRGAWFSLTEARKRILSTQIPFLESLAALDHRSGGRPRDNKPEPLVDPRTAAAAQKTPS
ncbi:NUDIX domain-containing protein [Acidobacteria bacterium AB60]|nr:NUDIX domain-containing protein [Acidobacteria bacterium AB60]